VNVFTKADILVGGTLDDEADRRNGVEPLRSALCGMADKGKKSSYARSAKSLQESATQAGPAMAASYTLVGAIIVLGGVGYAVDRWRGTSPWFLLTGLVVGVVIGFYEVIKTAYRK
jgi:ATP synthase protein I